MTLNFEAIQNLFAIGGLAMVAIAFCSVVALALFLERLWSLRSQNIIPTDLPIEAVSLLEQVRLEDAKTLCKKSRSSFAKVLLAGLNVKANGEQIVKEEVMTVGNRESVRLEQYLSILNLITMLAPLLGFLGTVSGMIDLFSTIAAKGEVQNIGELADGIYKALYTTAAGLAVAIPSLVFYKILISRVKRLTNKMEELTFHVLSAWKEAA